MSRASLSEVINELKTRGLRAGEEEGAKLVDDATQDAKKIKVDAQEEAKRIVDEARAEAESLRAQLDAELRQASSVGLEAFRQAVEASFLVPTVDDRLRRVLDDTGALKEILVETVRGFSASGGAKTELSVLLPDAKREQLDSAFVAGLKARAGRPVTVRFDDGFSFGFRIAPGGEGYLFDFSDEGFREIFLRFLAPRFRKYFFEEAP